MEKKLNEMTHKELQEKISKLPEVDHEPEMIHKRMNDINTFQCCEGELFLRGTDEYGNDFQLSVLMLITF